MATFTKTENLKFRSHLGDVLREKYPNHIPQSREIGTNMLKTIQTNTVEKLEEGDSEVARKVASLKQDEFMTETTKKLKTLRAQERKRGKET